MTDPELFPDPEPDEAPTGEYPAVPATDEAQADPPELVEGELWKPAQDASAIKG